MRQPPCPLCGGAFSPTPLEAKEMMFGTRDAFTYRRCSACQALVLADPPPDLSPYYPEGYYSMAPHDLVYDGVLKATLKKLRATVLLRLPVGVVARLMITRRVPDFFLWLAGRRLATSSSVCDVGSGSGQLLYAMAREGFTRLLGIDPYLDAEISEGPIRLRRCGVDDIAETHDLIMLNHVFEHMSDPRATLTTLRDRLRPGGTIIIRVPVADSEAAETYGADWVQLDPPRHLVIPTDAGMRALAHACGLSLTRAFRESTAFQFWGSEQYRRGIPLNDPRSYAQPGGEHLFSPAQIAVWERAASDLNARGRGDGAGYVLTPAERRVSGHRASSP